MSDNVYDIIVIGSGPGGQKAAVQGAKAGKRVAIIERDRNPGGACVYRGTIPSKTLLETAQTIERLKRNAEIFEFKLRDGLEVSTLMRRLQEVTDGHNRFIRDHLDQNGIERIHGRAKLINEFEVEVTGVTGERRTLNTRFVVIATGSRPRTPPGIPVDHENILDSDSILSMIYLPRSLVVLGSGVIACEYASIFSLLGCRVTLIDRASRPLPFLDPELTDGFLAAFQRNGGIYRGDCTVTNAEWDGVATVRTRLESGEVIESEKLLSALGRLANTEKLGLEECGLQLGKRGHIVVDEHYSTNIPNVYAVGDVIGPPALASCSMEQGRRAICHALGLDPGHAFELVPIGIYAVPEMACVGLSEAEAIRKFGDALVGRARFDEIARGQISGAKDGLLKLVADPRSMKLLGVQIVGEGATDLIHLGELALLNENPVSIFLENVLNFPTLGEAYRVAALNLLNQRPAERRSSEATDLDLPLAAIDEGAATIAPSARVNRPHSTSASRPGSATQHKQTSA